MMALFGKWYLHQLTLYQRLNLTFFEVEGTQACSQMLYEQLMGWCALQVITNRRYETSSTIKFGCQLILL
jgi:hypothetical protein